jgi:cytochrome c-type biogenesis protein CcmH
MTTALVRLLSVAAILMGLAAPASAIFSEEPLEDPRQEARAQEIMHSLRCLVCQNQSIAESDADLARDFRAIVRERIAAGDSDEEVVDYIVARYGDWVLLNPPLKPATYLLWLGPALLFLAGGAGLLFYARRRARRGEADAAEPLTPEDRARLARLLEETPAGGSGD